VLPYGILGSNSQDVFLLNKRTGKVLWRYPLYKKKRAKPRQEVGMLGGLSWAIGDRKEVDLCFLERVLSIEVGGNTPKWERVQEEPIGSKPCAISGNKLLVVSDSSTRSGDAIQVIDTGTGLTIWEKELPLSDDVDSSMPVPTEGQRGTNSNSVREIFVERFVLSGDKAVFLLMTDSKEVREGKRNVACLDMNNGSVQWIHTWQEGFEFAPLRMVGSGDSVYLHNRSDDGFYRINIENGNVTEICHEAGKVTTLFPTRQGLIVTNNKGEIFCYR